MAEWPSQKSTKEWHTTDLTSLRFSSVITMLALPLLFTYYDVRYLCACIKFHRSYVSSVNVVEATFAAFYLCLLFSSGLNFLIKYVSNDSLHIYRCWER